MGKRFMAALVAVMAILWGLHGTAVANESADTRAYAAITASFVGSNSCVSCHSQEVKDWQTSQHHDAMAKARASTVLADFNDTVFTHAGITSTFFQRDGNFYTQTSGPDGQLHDYHIKYTYGLEPLQQYLVEFPDGRLQPLPIAWDTRSQQQGGQRWFSLYPEDDISHKDELFWTRPAQNWNHMCADCHSTNVSKNYDAVTDTFKTNWSEINVGCEACHGPGSRHLQWLELKRTAQSVADYDNAGFQAQLNERRGVTWTIDPVTDQPVRSQSRETDHEIEVCAQCHARRKQIADGYQAGKPFLDYYRPALLVSPLYHADGQQHDEVFTWASFLQSKMYAKGVTCSDCHNPHSGQLRAEGNSVCASCHVPSKYDTKQHSRHQQNSAGAQCTACHMPTTTYMVVDPRHDHSMRVPRPDQTVKLGVPNACNQCHTERSATWAAAQIKSWYGHDPQGFQGYADAFAANIADSENAQTQLQAVAMDLNQATIARATALSQLDPSNYGAAKLLAKSLADPSDLVRLGSLASLAHSNLEELAPQVESLLSDPLRAVRIEAADILSRTNASQINPEARGSFEQAVDEYVTSQNYNADRAEDRVNLGSFYANRGDGAKAEEQMKAAIYLNPLDVPAYTNLADLYRAMGRDLEGEQLLRQGLQAVPQSPELHYALGLALVRTQQSAPALSQLRRATQLAPNNAQFAYVYAVALNTYGESAKAMAILERAIIIHPENRNILQALANFHQARGEHEQAQKYGKRLQSRSDQ